MNAIFFRWPFTLMTIGLFALLMLMAGCVVPGGGYGYDLGYYEPAGINYGGWSTGYDVGPVWGRDVHGYYGGGHPPPRAYRPAPASHPVPSIPSRAPRPGTPAAQTHGGPHGGPAH
ncbi:MAG TPA: hypothetical protein VG848_05155 [Acetobacteraceae bacterium]|jgi:hypothetical protein|nr:hypothetical protein [Acetobacteraceae bacterium]